MRKTQDEAVARAMEGCLPFTPARLLDIAVMWESVMKEKQASPDAHADLSFSFAYHRKAQALGIAAYMERHGIQERRNIGCFQLDFFKPGDIVTLRKGQTVHTTHPTLKGPVKRDRTVKVHTVFDGYSFDLNDERRATVVNPKIEWVGSGGYWYWIDIEDVIDGSATSESLPSALAA